MSACTICGRESSTCPGHLNERSNEWTPEMLQVCGGIPRTVQELVAELKRVQDEHDQARAEAMALRDALELIQKRITNADWCDAYREEMELIEKALATPSAGHLRVFAYDAFRAGAEAGQMAICDAQKNRQPSYPDIDTLWQQSAIRASLGKEGA